MLEAGVSAFELGECLHVRFVSFRFCFEGFCLETDSCKVFHCQSEPKTLSLSLGSVFQVPVSVSPTGLVSRPWSEFGTSKACRFCNVRAGAQAISGAAKSLQTALRGPPASNFVGLRLANQHSQAFEAS